MLTPEPAPISYPALVYFLIMYGISIYFLVKYFSNEKTTDNAENL